MRHSQTRTFPRLSASSPTTNDVLLGHADRARVIPPGPRAEMFPGYSGNLGGLLVDGFFRGLWRTNRKNGSTTLVVG